MSLSDLLYKINARRCFALVGSGPSCEMGYPSWRRLAELVISDLRTKNRITDDAAYQKYLANLKYPQLFGLAERDYGGRTEMLGAIGSMLTPSPTGTDHAYDLLCSWPFACYITTNYDTEIFSHLARKQLFFKELENDPADFYPLREGVSDYIFKLHGTLTKPSTVVLTAADYDNFEVSNKRSYYRDRLQQIFTMFDVLIVGHGLNDPDLDFIMRKAKEFASPTHPIYVILPDLNHEEVSELLNRYNIVALTYSNTDGTHALLRALLHRIDGFILRRDRRSVKTAICGGPRFLDKKTAFLRWRAALKMKESQCPERVRIIRPA